MDENVVLEISKRYVLPILDNEVAHGITIDEVESVLVVT